jgi:hypothetical protein
VTSAPSKKIWPVRGQVAGDEIEQRGFSGAVRPDQARDRATLDPQRAVVYGQQAAKAFDDVPDVDDCVEGHPDPS